jgi:hypothetical protein
MRVQWLIKKVIATARSSGWGRPKEKPSAHALGFFYLSERWIVLCLLSTFLPLSEKRQLFAHLPPCKKSHGKLLPDAKIRYLKY